MRLIGDVNDKRPTEPGDLRIVRRAGEGFEEYRIEQAEERSWGLRWLGLRWVPFVPCSLCGAVEFYDEREQRFGSLDLARRNAEAEIREHENNLARLWKNLQIEAATPVPCFWVSSPLVEDSEVGSGRARGSVMVSGDPSTTWAALEASPSESGEGMAPIVPPWPFSVSAPSSVGVPLNDLPRVERAAVWVESIARQIYEARLASSSRSNLRLQVSPDVSADISDAYPRLFKLNADTSLREILGVPVEIVGEGVGYAVVDDVTKD